MILKFTVRVTIYLLIICAVIIGLTYATDSLNISKYKDMILNYADVLFEDDVEHNTTNTQTVIIEIVIPQTVENNITLRDRAVNKIDIYEDIKQVDYNLSITLQRCERLQYLSGLHSNVNFKQSSELTICKGILAWKDLLED